MNKQNERDNKGYNQWFVCVSLITRTALYYSYLSQLSLRGDQSFFSQRLTIALTNVVMDEKVISFSVRPMWPILPCITPEHSWGKTMFSCTLPPPPPALPFINLFLWERYKQIIGNHGLSYHFLTISSHIFYRRAMVSGIAIPPVFQVLILSVLCRKQQRIASVHFNGYW